MVDVAALRSFTMGVGLASNQLKWLTNTFRRSKRIMYVRDDNIGARRVYEHLKWVETDITPEYKFFCPDDIDAPPYTCMTYSAQ